MNIALPNKLSVEKYVDAHSSRLIELSEKIWSTPELCYAETASSAAHAEILQSLGFRVDKGVAGIPTALIGEIGDGGPVIAFLGEYDALPDLSQEAGIARRSPLEKDGNGHGCGHNLLGSAALLAAIGLHDWLQANGHSARVRYYGCPAEEGGAGKAFMVRDGAFDDVDIAISWHPGCWWEVRPALSLANIRADFIFRGKSSHAAAAPHLGRSALDGVELMNVGVNYLREHIPTSARVHYAMIDSGGVAPNVVQANATVRYSIRAENLQELQELISRVRAVADGAAMMTGTSVEMKVLAGVANLLRNRPLDMVMHAAMEELGPPPFDAADMEFARQIQETLTPEDLLASYRMVGLAGGSSPLADFLVPLDSKRQPMIGSTDIGDVSWKVPTVQATGPCYAIGTPLHTWQVVAQGKSPAAHKAMVHVAKAMAATGASVVANPALLQATKAALDEVRQGMPYSSPIPPDVLPPLQMSK